MDNDLISRKALKKAFEEVYPLATNEMGGVVNKQIYEIIDNAPTVAVNCNDCDSYEAGYSAGLHDSERPQDEITDNDIREAIKTGFNEGYEMAKFKIQGKLISKVAYSIAEQYSRHGEVVPEWLTIGDIRV